MAKQPVSNVTTALMHGPNFYQYVKKIINSKQITYNQVDPGIVVDLYYNKPLENGKTMLKRYIVLVLSTKQVPGHDGRFIYGLSLEHILPSNFTRLIGRMGLDEMSTKLYKAKKVIFPRVLIPDGSNPKSIFTTYIRPKLDNTLRDSYRQFRRENIIKMYAIDFDWSKVLVDKFLKGDEPNDKGIRPSDGDNLESGRPD